MESKLPFLSPLAVDECENNFSLPSLLNQRQSSSPPLGQSIEAVEAESEERVTSEDFENPLQGHGVHLLLASLFGQRMHFFGENLDACPGPSAHFNTIPDQSSSLTIDEHDSLSDSYDLKGKGKERAKSPKRSPVPADSFFYLNVLDQMRLRMERNRRSYEEQDLERHMELEIADFESEDEIPLYTQHMSAFLPRKPEFIPGPSRITLDELQ